MTMKFPRTPTFAVRSAQCAFVMGLLSTTDLSAQVRASEQASVSQTVDGTVLTVEYYRPVLRGRVPFGGVVRWGEKWTPGANWATTFEASKDVHLNGQALPKGKYSVWFIPREREPWTVILHREARRFHMQRPADSGEVMRVTVPPDSGPPTETLTWDFPTVRSDGAVLQFRWGARVLPLAVRVEPSKPRVLSAAERTRYVGTYRLPPRGPRDPAKERLLVITETADGIRGRFTPTFTPEFDEEIGLLPTTDGRFRWIVKVAGATETEEFYLRFVPTDGRATAVELLTGLSDRVMMRGLRVE
jgi:hypothetical protein